uniref:LRRGT00198 n=1 Tax=Rattus norvegicus TaxID=10116 RepID=Q6QI10_RAT|nr:LRRGT00198 [Rattus norvegicus]
MWYIYTMEYYSAIKNNEFMKFVGKWLELENIILSELTQSQKDIHGMHSLDITSTNLKAVLSQKVPTGVFQCDEGTFSTLLDNCLVNDH